MIELINSFNVPLANVRANWNKITQKVESNSKYLLMFEKMAKIYLCLNQRPTAISNLEEEAADLAKF
jgi:hypothetical protein